VASDVPGIEDVDLLQPRRLYERRGRTDEYRRLVEGLRADRAEYMAGFPGLVPEVATAL
jgi:phosphoenolpyruvate carboxykinase (ATP)